MIQLVGGPCDGLDVGEITGAYIRIPVVDLVECKWGARCTHSYEGPKHWIPVFGFHEYGSDGTFIKTVPGEPGYGDEES